LQGGKDELMELAKLKHLEKMRDGIKESGRDEKME
jgi:hypothetical protein